MTDEEILKALDESTHDDILCVGDRKMCSEAAAMIRRLQGALGRFTDLLNAGYQFRRSGADVETIRDRDMRAVLSMLHPIHHVDADAVAKEAYRIADALAEERTRRNGY